MKNILHILYVLNKTISNKSPQVNNNRSNNIRGNNNRSTVLHNMFSLDMSIFHEVVVKNDPVEKQHPFLIYSRPSLGTRRQNFSPQSFQ